MSNWLNLDGLERIKVQDAISGDKLLRKHGNQYEEFTVSDPGLLPSGGTYYLLDRLVSTADATRGVVPGAIGYARFKDGTEAAGLVEVDGRFVYVSNNVAHYVYTEAISEFQPAIKPAAIESKGK